jgi:hypothetical protein
LSKKRIKSPKAEKEKISVPSNNNLENEYPVFCFKHLNLGINSKGDYKFYFQFIERLNKLSNISWKEINISTRHGFGTEKLPISQIKPDLPLFITPDVKELLVFRANGDNRPFLGLRMGKVFHIVFIEEQFGEIYNH